MGRKTGFLKGLGAGVCVVAFALYFVFANVALGAVALEVLLGRMQEARQVALFENDKKLGNAFKQQGQGMQNLSVKLRSLEKTILETKKNKRRWYFLWLF